MRSTVYTNITYIYITIVFGVKNNQKEHSKFENESLIMEYIENNCYTAILVVIIVYNIETIAS